MYSLLTYLIYLLIYLLSYFLEMSCRTAVLPSTAVFSRHVPWRKIVGTAQHYWRVQQACSLEVSLGLRLRGREKVGEVLVRHVSRNIRPTKIPNH